MRWRFSIRRGVFRRRRKGRCFEALEGASGTAAGRRANPADAAIKEAEGK